MKRKSSNNSIRRGRGFKCYHCGQWVGFAKFIGTEHRNHCPFCLWSKHVDFKKSGDRKAKCLAKMKPIGLTFKHEGKDKYGTLRQGEIMVIQECLSCGELSINRIAGDDSPEMILTIFEESQRLSPEKRNQLKGSGIEVSPPQKRKEILIQLFGKDFQFKP